MKNQVPGSWFPFDRLTALSLSKGWFFGGFARYALIAIVF